MARIKTANLIDWLHDEGFKCESSKHKKGLTECEAPFLDDEGEKIVFYIPKEMNGQAAGFMFTAAFALVSAMKRHEQETR